MRFYDIKPNRVTREDIIHIGGAVPCPELQVSIQYGGGGSLEDGTVWVRFYDVKPNRVTREDIIHIGGAVPCPELQVSIQYGGGGPLRMVQFG